MNASEIAKRTKQAEALNAQTLWEEMQPKIMSQIENQAENRCWALHIDRDNELNKYDILFYECVREHFIRELEKLEFKCDWQLVPENRDRSKLIVSWEHLKEA